jgi:orotidine-5'-phosphate decarboxylase
MFRRGTMRLEDPGTASAIEEFCYAVIDVIGENVAVIKPQASLFECLGSVGWTVLERVIRHARSAGLLVLLDAKRGDIADTAAGYAKAYLSSDSSLIVDAMTVNAYLGPETVKPFITEAKRVDEGLWF